MSQFAQELESSRQKLLASIDGSRDLVFLRGRGNLGDDLIYAVEVGFHSNLRRSNGLYQAYCNPQSEPFPDRALPDFSAPQRVEVS